MNKDYYKTLGVEKDATPEDIKKAYRKEANEHHPDKNDGQESETFTDLVEAYECLGNGAKRHAYDNGSYTNRTESLEKKANRLVAESFVKGLGAMSEDDAKYKNVVEFMKEQLTGIILNIKNELITQEGNKRKFIIARDRITGKTSMLYDVATVNINQFTLLISDGQDELAAFECALLLADDYEYKVDARETPTYGSGSLIDLFTQGGQTNIEWT